MNHARSAAALTAFALLAFGAEIAEAAVTGELAPTVSVGVTTNAAASGTGAFDEIVTIGAFHRLRIDQPRTRHEVTMRLSFAHYFRNNGIDTVTAAAGYSGSFELTRALELRLSASEVVSRTSQFDLFSIATIVPQASPSGSTAYFSSGGGQNFIYRPTLAWLLSESFDVLRIDYLGEAATTRPPAMAFTGVGRVEYIRQLDAFSLEARATDLSSGPVPAIGMFPANPGGHSFLGESLLGWRREFTREWAAEARLGVGVLRVRGGDSTLSPAGSGTLLFRRELWFATLMASRVTVANMFAALATINDQVYLRLTLPLNRSERLVIGGFAGLTSARAVDVFGAKVRAYNQGSVGARVGTRLRQLPIVIAVDYTFVDQVGYMGSALGNVSTFMRHTVMLQAAGTFQWGPGTPSILGGGGFY